MIRFPTLTIIASCCISMMLIACGCHQKEEKTRNQSIQGKPAVFSGVDATGDLVVLHSYPERIVSLAPSNTEILFALGIGNKVVGRTRYCDYPQQALTVPVVGGFIDINVEKVLSLKPDLVLGIRGNPDKVIKELKRVGSVVFVIDPGDIKDIVASIGIIGDITGTVKQARKITSDLELRIKKVTDLVKSIPDKEKPKVFYGDWKPPISTAGPNNPIDSLITMAGGINIAQDAGVPWPKYSFERIMRHNPDIILSGFKSDEALKKHRDQLVREIKKDPLWSKLNAVKTNRIFFIDEDMVMRPGPRMVDALEILARYFHPRFFGSHPFNTSDLQVNTGS